MGTVAFTLDSRVLVHRCNGDEGGTVRCIEQRPGDVTLVTAHLDSGYTGPFLARAIEPDPVFGPVTLTPPAPRVVRERRPSPFDTCIRVRGSGA